MELYERLYDETERVNVQFIGMTTDNSRFDFGIVYTSLFFGKPLITCMQSGRSLLLGREDLDDVDHLMRAFNVKSRTEAESLSEFFKEALPPTPLEAQY